METDVLRFAAAIILAEKNDEDEYYMVGFIDNENNYDNYIILQKGFDYSDEDEDFDMEEEYIEVNDQGNGGYGICTQAVIKSNLVVFSLQYSKTSNLIVEVDTSKVNISDEFTDYIKFILGSKVIIGGRK